MPSKTVGEQFARWCVNFTGLQNRVCKAGVAYSGGLAKGPCFKENESHTDCPKRRFPNQAEVEAHVDRIEKHIEKMHKASVLILEVKKEHKGKNWKGTKTCPACGGTLHLSHSSYNGHVWGKCETEDCLSWME